MSGSVQRAAESATKRYETLLRVSQNLISIRSSEELFKFLALELRAVVSFYVMGVGIYDENAHEMITTAYGEPGIPLQVRKFGPEETFSWWVYQHQQPLIIPSFDAETRFPAVAKMLKDSGVRSVCAFPLTTVHRRLGGLSVGSLEEDAYGSEEVSFLSLIANHVALAVDGALNFDASQRAGQAQRASEQSFRQIVDSMPAFAWCAGPDGKLEYLNRRIVDYTGERQENLVGFGWANVLHPEDVERTKMAWLHSVETGDPCVVDQRVRRFDNVYRWFRTVAQPLRDDGGRVIRWYGVATDIEDWKRAEEAVRASEERLRMIVDNIPGLVGTRAATGEPEFVNRQMLEFFGQSLEQLPDWTSLIHQDDRERVVNLWRRSVETGQPYDVEHRARRADGAFRWLHCRAQPLRDAEGRIIRWCIMLTDMDDRRRAEEALRASDLNFRVIIDSIPGLVHTLTASGELEFVNQQNLDYFGKSLEELRSWATSDVFHPDDLARAIEAWKHTQETGQPEEIECRLRRADGAYRWFQLRCLPLRDSENRIIRWMSLHTDIDERKQAEGRLQLLLEVTNQVVSNLQLRDLLRAISGSIRRVMQCDCASLALPNAETEQLQLNVLDFPEGKGFFHEEGVYSIEGSPYGTAFRTMKPLALHDPFTEWLDNPVVQSRVSEGFKSLCFIPVIRRSRAIGTLNLGRLRGDAFTEQDLYFLGQVASQIAIAVENALEYGQVTEAKERLAEQKLYLEDEIRVEQSFEEIIGKSSKLKAVLKSVRIVAPADSTVLIQGETGTGKEMIARAIHKLSSRKDQAFVKVNCAAIPLGLLESELFGHERGAFTGAIAQKVGRFELAHKGTLFLDEVGDIPLELQPKLLRVLQEQEFERLGSNRTQRVDVRVLAATNVSLTQMVAEKKFRSDLYYRLKVFPIDVPPLRDRREDIPLLVRYFSNKYARRMG
jgi:PAS domain S-box-containing protein